ncbi:outer membrane beta-barrel family protein [Chryseobacterium balustinum]|uniref:Outer membrane receptor for Fe3+-dicitrate n=1 Tax=Chryseobacterium balustinum TaxID=246 RepID=A0AAX2ITF7_9FLAO|nr:outer membrane beta-barrel family protein [Chryseobacterium balustinum]AZB30972.1 TonB-dependent receptor [Chryseobacterium balustinum]SKB42104.1 Outer membrane receptor proteins, mostly Fe transport [Chryseobacterium balustinum]SQA92188.1 Outer membrane receptor for Fe3+-dicitrate [Chryseobacterium balustinum]
MNVKLWIFILLLFLSFFAKSQEILKTKVPDSIQQKDSVATISEVIIQSSHRDLKLNQGNIVMNVSGNKDFKTSTNILEVLRKTPGVTVDSEDGIFIGGRVSPAIFINGKPVVMSNQELQSYLRSLSPEMVESLEVNTNPSSKYDAEFKGIIDIKLKKNTNLGWIGNYIGNTSVNKFNYKENSLNLSYNTQKISYNVQLGYNNGISTYRYNALQRLANTNVMRTQTYQKDDAKIYTIQVGIDYKLNDKNRFGVNVRSNFRDSERIRLGSLYTLNKDETQLIFNTGSKNPINYFQDNYGISTDYSFQHKNFKLSFLGNYLSVKNKQEDDFLNSDKPNSQLLSYWKSDLLNKIIIYTGQIDVSQIIGDATFDAGLKLSDTKTNNMIRYDTLSVNQQFVFDPARSNQFSYKEKIFAGYWAYSQKFNNLQINAGLRFENTQSISNAVTVDSVVSRNYLKWLPSFSVSYAFNKSSELSFSYSRKMTRPVFSQLNPFRFYYSPLNYWIGNPYLQPSFTNQIKATYRYKNWVTAFTIGKETDVMTRYPIYNPETNVLEFLGTNLPYRNFASLETSFPVKITKWWNINTQFAGYYNYEFRPYLDKVFALKIYNYEMRLNQVFSLPKGYTLNIFSNYESKTGNSLYIIKPRYTVDISVQKAWFDNTLNSKISFNNIFDSYDQRLEFRHKQIIDNQFTHWWDTQKLILSLSYSFGNSKYQTKNIQKTDEEYRAR